MAGTSCADGSPTRVVAHAGGRGDEEPRAFEHDGRRLAVEAVLERWQEPAGRGFRVLAEDGRCYGLLQPARGGAWRLSGPQPGAPGTDAKVAFLSRPASHPGSPRRVEVVETHMAWVFLAGRHAYKMKKPVRHEFLDFSTLAARKRICEEELRLNRRLAEGVYLGVVPLTLEPDGRLRLGGTGVAVEWLVHMRRLPGERMLDRVLARGGGSATDVERLAEVLARFYRSLPSEELSPDRYVARLAADVERERAGLAQAGGGLDPAQVARIASRLAALLARRRELFEERARAGRIVEAHGDLRPEHVCLLRRPVVIDCLEFRREFRVLDPADELAFFALECAGLGAPAFGRDLIAAVERASGDAFPPELVELHMARRAFLRAKLAIWHLRDPGTPEPERWTLEARGYLDAAEEHLAAAGSPDGS